MGLESIGVEGHENRCFRGRRSWGEVVRGHRSWELHGSDVGRLRRPRDCGPEPSQRVWRTGACLCASRILP